MGISISVIIVTDDQIRAFGDDPDGADELCNTAIPHHTEDCYLMDWWGCVHDLLKAGDAGDPLPYGMLEKGEVEFEDVSDPTWAVYSGTVKALAIEIAPLAEEDLRGRCVPGETRLRNNFRFSEESQPTWQAEFAEAIGHFTDFRKCVLKAAEEQKGLLFCRYEDY